MWGFFFLSNQDFCVVHFFLREITISSFQKEWKMLVYFSCNFILSIQVYYPNFVMKNTLLWVGSSFESRFLSLLSILILCLYFKQHQCNCLLLNVVSWLWAVGSGCPTQTLAHFPHLKVTVSDTGRPWHPSTENIPAVSMLLKLKSYEQILYLILHNCFDIDKE